MSIDQDAFARTAAALTITFRAHGALLDSTPAQFCNYLLDACGSDHRPLVDLLLSSGTLLRPHLLAGDARTPWDVRRAPLVHRLVATRYLQSDVARWLVDTWGAALAVAPEQVVRPSLEHGATVAAGQAVGFTRAVGMVPATAAPPVPARIGTVTPLRPPSWTNGRAARRLRTKTLPSPGSGVSPHPAAARALVPRWRTTTAPMSLATRAKMQRVERIAYGTMVSALVVGFFAAFMGLRSRRIDSVLVASVLPAIERGSIADSVVAAATAPTRPLSTALTNGITDIGTLATTQPRVSGAQLISIGVGGRYRVSQRSVTVTGSPSCVTVAQALARAPSTTEVVTHVPGTFAFTLASRSVNGRLDADAYFDAGPQRGTTDGVTWTFQMRGQFTQTGFSAETNTNTAAIIRWGHTQSCTTVAQLVGERLPQ